MDRKRQHRLSHFFIFLSVGFWWGVLKGYSFAFSVTHHFNSVFSFSLSPLEEIPFLMLCSLCGGVVFAGGGLFLAVLLSPFPMTQRMAWSIACGVFLPLVLFRLRYLEISAIGTLLAGVLSSFAIGFAIWHLLKSQYV